MRPLGAALAEMGDFERAMECAQRALALSQTETGADDRAVRGVGEEGTERGNGRPGAAGDIAARLLLYRAGRPFRISGGKKKATPD